MTHRILSRCSNIFGGTLRLDLRYKILRSIYCDESDPVAIAIVKIILSGLLIIDVDFKESAKYEDFLEIN